MGSEAVRRIPPFDEWKAAWRGIEKQMTPPDLQRLYSAVAAMDMTVMRINDRNERLLRVATVNVFYQTTDKRYKLRETRYTINQGRDPQEVLEEVLSGDMSGVTSSSRANWVSVSERMRLTGETREHATLRALHEELFDGVLSRSERAYPNLDTLLSSEVVYHDPTVVKVAADAPDATFKGIPARYFLFPASITFTPEMDVPITLKDGVPQRLFEYAEEQFINLHDWDEVS